MAFVGRPVMLPRPHTQGASPRRHHRHWAYRLVHRWRAHGPPRPLFGGPDKRSTGHLQQVAQWGVWWQPNLLIWAAAQRAVRRGGSLNRNPY